MHRTLAAIAAILLVGGCQTVGTYYDRMLGRSEPAVKPAPLENFKPSLEAYIVWQTNIGAAGKFEFTPVVSAGHVYAANAAGELIKIDAASGKVEWRMATEARLSAGPGTDGRTIAVGTARGEVIAVDSSGKAVWRAQITGEVLSPPVLEDGVVAVRSGDGRIFGLSAQDGKRRWLYQRALPALTVRAPAGLTAVPGGVYSGFAGGKLVAVLLKNGILAWEATVSTPRGSTELERMADIVGPPLVDGRAVCAAAYQGRMGCFDALKGVQIWVRDLSSLAPLSADARYIYATDDKGAVHALDKVTGASIWKQEKLVGRAVTGGTPLGEFVAVGDYQGYVHFLSRADGAFAARVATDGSPILQSPVRAGNTLLVQTRNGGLFSVAPR
jgi:outer membrane protein assembly factor BamB